MARSAFEWIGENLALDFVNTTIPTYRDLIAWTREAHLSAGRLTDGPSDETSRVADLARRVREILYEILSSAADARAPDPKRLAQFNAALSAALDRIEVIWGANGPSWGWGAPEDELEKPLWPVLWAAANLLAGPEARKIRRCTDPECGRLYIDRSRRGDRRWCSMKRCGNRAKSRRHYARLREAGNGLR